MLPYHKRRGKILSQKEETDFISTLRGNKRRMSSQEYPHGLPVELLRIFSTLLFLVHQFQVLMLDFLHDNNNSEQTTL
jgi:hypothetical protein